MTPESNRFVTEWKKGNAHRAVAAEYALRMYEDKKTYEQIGAMVNMGADQAKNVCDAARFIRLLGGKSEDYIDKLSLSHFTVLFRTNLEPKSQISLLAGRDKLPIIEEGWSVARLESELSRMGVGRPPADFRRDVERLTRLAEKIRNGPSLGANPQHYRKFVRSLGPVIERGRKVIEP